MKKNAIDALNDMHAKVGKTIKTFHGREFRKKLDQKSKNLRLK